MNSARGFWVAPWKIEPPTSTTILARYRGYYCFVAYSKALQLWKLIANGTERLIDPPEEWWCEGERPALLPGLPVVSKRGQLQLPL